MIQPGTASTILHLHSTLLPRHNGGTTYRVESHEVPQLGACTLVRPCSYVVGGCRGPCTLRQGSSISQSEYTSSFGSEEKKRKNQGSMTDGSFCCQQSRILFQFSPTCMSRALVHAISHLWLVNAGVWHHKFYIWLLVMFQQGCVGAHFG